ncbi:polyprenol monophosphomannose synthase [Glaciihabitans sp. UYNi722]|uniref:polyprenol monophosphomannose synthase n=1 Tax=Glaciihabitans sp. UYNi722 TaxID=3156344 RepID=UPI003392502D
MADTLIILPTYDEIESLESVIGRIRQWVPIADVLVVDDASPDGTGELADRLAAADPGIAVMHRAGKSGLGRAYLAGFDYALTRGYRFVVEIDADGSHDPAELPAMLEIADAGAELVIGSRWVAGGSVRNWPWLRQAISRTGNWYARTVLRSRINDITAGYRVYSSDALRSLDLSSVSSQGYCFQVELAWNLESAGKTVAEHPITFVERAAGRSKMHAGIVIEALLRVTLWGLFRTKN